jgi:hypothetical protein
MSIPLTVFYPPSSPLCKSHHDWVRIQADDMPLCSRSQFFGHRTRATADIKHTLGAEQVGSTIEMRSGSTGPFGLPGELPVPRFGRHYCRH